MDPFISISADLTMRVMRPGEAGALYILVKKNREHLRQWLPWVDQVRIPHDSRRFLEVSYGGFMQGAGFNFGIRFQGALVGLLGFHGFDYANRVTSLGYWLCKDHCGKGLMRQSVAAALEYAYRVRKMNRVFIRCATGNERSKRIPLALGFTYEGTQREAEWMYDRFLDLEVYSLLAEEWEQALIDPNSAITEGSLAIEGAKVKA
jgi:ribosomal-protein-serine acetyltransferase